MGSRTSSSFTRGALVALALATLGGCNCLDLSVPPRPMSGGFEGLVDVQGHIPKADNELKLVRTDGPGSQTAKTDADGKFSFGGLVPGLYMIQADLAGFAPLREGPFQLVPGNTTDLGTFRPVWLSQTPSEGSISGLVIVAGGATAQDGGVDAGAGADAGGRPSDAEGATVAFLLERTGGQPAKVAEATVNAFGTFSARLPPGTYTLEATHPYYVAARRTGVVLGAGQQLDLVPQPLVLEVNPATVTGSVTLELESLGGGPSTRPGAGVQVTADTGQTATVDVSGNFRLSGLAAGTRRLIFQLAGYHDDQSDRAIQLTAGQERALPPVRLLLDRGDIAGRVRMSDGSQLDGVTVQVAGALDGGAGSYSVAAVRSATDPSVGDFLLRGLPVGPYEVVARRTNYVDATSPPVTVTVGTVFRIAEDLRLARLQGDFTIDDGDGTNTPGYTRERPVTLVLSNVVNAAEYRVAEGSQAALMSATYQAFTSPRVPFTLSAGDGVKTVYLQIKNTMGNEGAALSASVVLDTTAPANASLELGDRSGFTRASTFPVAVSATDLGGVSLMRLVALQSADAGLPLRDAGVGDAGTQVLDVPSVQYVRNTSLTSQLGADGVQPVAVQFIDNAGNFSVIVEASVVIDTTAPSGSATIRRGIAASLDGFTNDLNLELDVSVPAEPNGGRLFLRLANEAAELPTVVAEPLRTRMAHDLDPGSDGAKTVHYQFVDSAGNLSAAGQATITLDRTRPVVVATLLSPSPTADAGITLGLNTTEANPYAPDAGLALSEVGAFANAVELPYPSNSQATFQVSSGDGRKTVTVRVRDAAGNEGTSAVAVDLDTTAPSGTRIDLVGRLADGTPSAALTSANTVTVNLTHVGATRVSLGDENVTACPALDSSYRAITGIAIANHPLPGGTGATRTVTACFADEAGNVTPTPATASIDFDGQAPGGCQLQLTGLSATTLNSQPTSNGKTAQTVVPFTLTGCPETPREFAYTEQPNVTCTATATGLVWRALDGTTTTVTLSSVDGTKTVRGCVRDAARNTASFTEAVLTLDTTPPSNARVVINGGAAYVSGAQADAGVVSVTIAGTAVGAATWAVAEDTTPSTFVDFATQNPVTLALSAGDGVKTVKALFRDDVGNQTPGEAQDSIDVDTTAPTLSNLRLVGLLADGTPSVTTTTQAEVTAEFVQTGATTIFVGNDTLTSCPTTGHTPLVGNSARVTLPGSGTTRTVKLCVGDAAGNVSSVATASIDFDGQAPTGCALVLTGLRADTLLPTDGGAATKTGRADVQYTVTGCGETPADIVLTESPVSCSAAASLPWRLYSATSTNTFALGGVDGLKTVRGCVRDASRNTAPLVASSITLDTTPPFGASVTIRGGAPYFNQADALDAGSNTMLVTGSASGAVEWALAQGATPTTYGPVVPTPFTFSTGDGAKTITALFKDDVGNTSTPAEDSIVVDTEAPTLTALNLSGSLADGTPSSTKTASTTIFASVVQSGGNGLVLGGASLNCAGASYQSNSGGSVQNTLTGTGTTRTVRACVTDAAGNLAGPATATIDVDEVAPSGCQLVLGGKRADDGLPTPSGLNKTGQRDVSVTFTGCAESPVEIFLTESTVTCSATASLDWRSAVSPAFSLTPGDGLKTVRGCVRDAMRNVGTLQSDDITLDMTPPSGGTVSIKSGATYFNRADFLANVPNSNTMPVTGTALGATEWALAETGTPTSYAPFTSPATLTVAFSSGDGRKTIRGKFRDDVGNTTVVEAEDEIDVDTTVPVLASFSLEGALADGTSSSASTTSSQVTVKVQQTGASAVQLVASSTTTCPVGGYTALQGSEALAPLPGSGTVRSAKVCLVDLAGNVSTPSTTTATMTVDATSPSGCALNLIGRTKQGGTTAGAAQDKTAEALVGVTVTGCDEAAAEVGLTESPAVTCSTGVVLDWKPLSSATFTLSFGDGAKTVRGCVRDATRNVGPLVQDVMTLDTTPPLGASVTINSGATYVNAVQADGGTTVSVAGSASGAAEWAIAEGTLPSVFQAIATANPLTFTFSAGDGDKTIRAIFRDDVGNASPEVTDGITFDTVPPQFNSFTLEGTLADGTVSTARTVTERVNARIFHSNGGASVAFGGPAMTSCPTTGYQLLNGNLAELTLPGTGTPRIVRACLADLAGNTTSLFADAGVASDDIEVDATPPGGCAVTLVGKRADDGQDTGGATANKTALREVRANLSCGENVNEVVLTEATTINCASTSLAWLPVTANTITYQLSALDGTKTVRGCVRDSALNVGTLTPDDIVLDTTPPQAASVLIDNGAEYVNQAQVTSRGGFRASVQGSAVGAALWAIAEGALSTDFRSYTTENPRVNFAFTSGEGTKEIWALFKDDVGNTTTVEVRDGITFDTQAPTLTSFTLSGLLADGTPSPTHTITTTVNATLIQTGGTQLFVGGGSLGACPTSGYVPYAGGSTGVALPAGTGGTPDVRTVRVCVADPAGNTAGPSAVVSMTVDSAPPASCTLTLAGLRADGSAGAPVGRTAKQAITAAVSCLEAPTEIYLTESGTPSCTPTAGLAWVPLVGGGLAYSLTAAEGAKVVSGCVRDAARNVGTFSSVTMTLDTTPPQNPSVTIKNGDAYFNNADFVAAGSTNAMPVRGNATGANEWALAEGAVPSSWAAFTSPQSTQSFTFSAGQGSRTVRALFRDDVWNTIAVEVQDSIEVDTGVPTFTSISVSGTLADGTVSTTNTAVAAVNVGLTQSGGTRIVFGDASMTSCPTTGYADFVGTSVPTTLLGTGTTRTVRACVADVAGNRAGPVTDLIDFDGTPPGSCSLVLVGKRTDTGADTGGATAEKTGLRNVKATLSGCNETITEMALTEASTVDCSPTAALDWQPVTVGSPSFVDFTLSDGDGTKTVKGCVRDAARNSNGLTQDTIALDTTPPTLATVSIKGGAAYFNRADWLGATPANTNTMQVTGSATGATHWALAEAATPSSFAALAPVNVTFSAGEGTKTIRALFQDDVGNVTTVETQDDIVVDTISPTLSALALEGTLADGTASSALTASTTVTGTVTHTGASLVFFGDGSLSACPASGYTTLVGNSGQATVASGTSGTRTVRACVADAAGNTAGPAAATIDYDGTRPSGCTLTLIGKRADGTDTGGATANLTAQQSITATVACAEAVADVYLQETSGALTCPSPNSAAWQSYGAGFVGFTLSANPSILDQLKTVKACVRDAARNVILAAVQDDITLDVRPPYFTSVTIFGGAQYFNAANFAAAVPTNTNTMQVTASGNDIVEWSYTNDDTAPSPTAFSTVTSPLTVTFPAGDGTKRFRTLFRDAVGNVTSFETQDSIEVDTELPDFAGVSFIGTLADGTTSTTLHAPIPIPSPVTNAVTVTANVLHTGASRIALTTAGTACPAFSTVTYVTFSGSSRGVSLPALPSATTRARRVCVADAAGNIATASFDATIDVDLANPQSCVLTLVGKRADTGADTGGATANKTALQGVTASLASCTEAPADIHLLETASPSFACPAPGAPTWQTLNGNTTIPFNLSSGDGPRTVKGCVRDAARRVSPIFTDDITLDATPPTATAVTLHTGNYFNLAAFQVPNPDSNTMNVNAVATDATEWAYAENAPPTSFGAFTSPTNLSFLFSAGDGTKVFRALFKDDVGNVTPSEAQDTIIVDTVPPSFTGITIKGRLADGSTSDVVTQQQNGLTLDFAQAGGSLFAYGGATFTCPVLTSFSALSGTQATVNLTGTNATETLRACVSDEAGNIVGFQQDSITYDAAAPANCVLTLNGKKANGAPTALDKTALLQISGTLSSCNETPTDIYFLETTGSISCPTAGDTSSWIPLVGSAASVTVSATDGLKTVKACVRDAARNVTSAVTADTITLDQTPPTSARVSIRSGDVYFNRQQWLAAGSANVMAADGSATGAIEWAYKTDGTNPTTTDPRSATPSGNGVASPTPTFLPTGDGTKWFRAIFFDDVGNPTDVVTDDIIIDTAAPTLSSVLITGELADGTPSTSLTANANVSLSLVHSGGATQVKYGPAGSTCTTGMTAYSTLNGNTTPASLGGTGYTRTVVVCIADPAGNDSAAVQDTIDFDQAAPTTCALALVGRKLDGTNTSGGQADLTALRDVTVSVTGCADSSLALGLQYALVEAGSVVCNSSAALVWQPAGTATITLSSGDGPKTVAGCVRDALRNIGSLANTDSITLDTTAPDDAFITVNSTNGFVNVTTTTITANGYATGASEWATSSSPSGPWTYTTFPTSPTAKLVGFSSPDGQKFLYARFRDALQNASPVVSTSVVLDTTPPIAPVLLTVDAQNRSARLFWDATSDLNGLLRYELLCGTSTPSSVCATTSGTATDGWVLNLADKTDYAFAVRAVDSAGNASAASGSMSSSVGWRRASVNPGSVYPLRPLDIALKGNDVYVTFMETDYGWAGIAGTLKIAVSHDRGQSWSFRTLDSAFGGNRSVAAIGFTDSLVVVTSAANDGFATDVIAGRVSVWASEDRGDSWTDVSHANLGSSANYAKVDSLGLQTAGPTMRLLYMLASGTSEKRINRVSFSGPLTADTSSPTAYANAASFGNAPYQLTNGLKACSGNYTSVAVWRDRNSSGGAETNLRSIVHYYLSDNVYDAGTGEGLVQALGIGAGAGSEVGSFDLGCTSLPESTQAYLIYNRAPASAWAVGSGGTVLRWDDTTWANTQSPTTKTIYSVQDVWAVGAGYVAAGVSYDTILRWNGTSWEELQLSTVAEGNNLYDIWSSSPSNVLAVGSAGTIIRWDGSAWTALSAPAGYDSTLNGIWGSSAANVWAVGSYDSTAGVTTNLLRYNGSSWASFATPTTDTLNAVWGTSSSNVWAVGTSGRIIRFNGTSWSTVASPTTATLNSIWGTASNNIVAVGTGGTIIRYDGTSWATVASPTSSTLYEVAGVASSEVWAVGNNGTAIKWDGSSWAIVPTATTNTLFSVWGGTSGGGSANTIYKRVMTDSLSGFGSSVSVRTDADPSQPPRLYAGGRNVYVLYRDTTNRLLLGESTNEMASFNQWTTLSSGNNKGLYAVLGGDSSSDVAVAFTDVAGASFTVMVPGLSSLAVTPSAGIGIGSIAWASVASVDRYQVDADPDGAAPWANVDFTSLTQVNVPPPPGLAPFIQVRAVDPRGMPGNTGEVWRMRPFSDVALVTNTSTAPSPSEQGGIVAYNDKVAVWPTRSSLSGNEFTLYRSTDYGTNWTSHSPATISTTGARAIAGFGGKMVMFYEDVLATSNLRAYTFTDLAGTGTLTTIQAGVPLDLVSAKASSTNNGIVVAYADTASDIIRVATLDTNLNVTLRTSISTTAANTIGSIEVAKADLSTGRIVVSWREYSADLDADPGEDLRNDLVRIAESTNSGASWTTPLTLLSGDSSTTSNYADYFIGSSQLSGSNNGAYSVLAHVSQFNDFWHTAANLHLTVTGTDHGIDPSTYSKFYLETEACDSRSVDAFANGDGHYLTYRTESLDGTIAKLKLAYCVSDCHLTRSWNRSLLKTWTASVKEQAKVVNMTVGQVSSTAYDPAIYVLYQEAGAGSSRTLRVLSRGVHRRQQ